MLSPKATAKPGRYNPDLTPWVRGMHAALDDPSISEVACQKSAQVAWTDGVLLNYIGRRIDVAPCPIIIMFPKEGAAKEFNSEKFEPMVECTPTLADKIPVHSRRDKDNRWQFKGFPGGFLKFVSSNSPSSVKTTPAPVVCVEEPDDANENVKDQGDTITILRERTKSYARRKMIFGGTPTIEGISRIAAAYDASDRRKFYVACPHCEEPQVLSWDNVKWDDTATVDHEVFGRANPETARYCCPHCGSLWTDAEKNRAVRQAESQGHGWKATAPFNGVAGFYINELYSPFPGSRLVHLVRKYLTAVHALSQGDDTKIRSFRNNTEGLPYAYVTDVPDGSDLKIRAETYAEFTVPHGGLLLTMGVDVQHDRLAVVIRAWGRGEESWLVYWGELYGSTLIPGEGAFKDLDALADREYRHASGATLRVSAFSIDGSDGNRTEIVNAYVRKRRHKGFMAIKGASEQGNDKKEIFSTPRMADTGKRQKPAKFGLQNYIVGTHRAKDLILETRVKLKAGAGCMHWYEGVRPDYWDQLTAEVKAPSKANRARKTWQKKGGQRNEALDCEVYALHAARSLKTHLMLEGHWAALENRLRQRSLIAEDLPEADPQDDNELEAPQSVAVPEQSGSGAEKPPAVAEGATPRPEPQQPRTPTPPAEASPPAVSKKARPGRTAKRRGGFVNGY